MTDKTPPHPTLPQLPLKTKKGQRHISPAGRHSQQTHQRAAARAAEQGYTTEKEQHAHDRSVVVAELDRLSAQKLKQQQDNQNRQRTGPKTGEAESKEEVG